MNWLLSQSRTKVRELRNESERAALAPPAQEEPEQDEEAEAESEGEEWQTVRQSAKRKRKVEEKSRESATSETTPPRRQLSEEKTTVTEAGQKPATKRAERAQKNGRPKKAKGKDSA